MDRLSPQDVGHYDCSAKQENEKSTEVLNNDINVDLSGVDSQAEEKTGIN